MRIAGDLLLLLPCAKTAGLLAKHNVASMQKLPDHHIYHHHHYTARSVARMLTWQRVAMVSSL
jgi:hypothetical protein